jgi:hypothetical protein
MTALRDEDAVRHPYGCEFCGKFRAPAQVGHFGLTRLGYMLKVCADCFKTLEPQYKQLRDES